VVFLPTWEEIYENDGDRKMIFEQAKQFGDDIRKTCDGLCYSVASVLMEAPNKSAEFIHTAIQSLIDEATSGGKKYGS